MRYESLLRANGMKSTPQRLAILEEIETHGHIGIEEIYHHIQQRFPSMSLATIYKNIISLQEARIIREVRVPRQKHKYEIAHAPHAHLVCQTCGTIVDIDLSLDALIQQVHAQTQFSISESALAFGGTCKECLSAS